MKDENQKYSEFVGKNVIIILSNQMRYTGNVQSVGNEYITISDKFEKTVYIVLSNICSIEEVEA